MMVEAVEKDEQGFHVRVKRVIQPCSVYGHEIMQSICDDPAECDAGDNDMKDMVGLLKQIGLLAHFATEMFAEVYEITRQTSKDIGNLNLTIDKIEHAMKQGNSLDVSQTSPDSSNQQEKRSSQLQQLYYNECEPHPALHTLDAYSKDGCLKHYTNPQLFFREWVKVGGLCC